MPTESRPEAIPVRVTNHADSCVVTFEWNGRTYQRVYGYVGDDDRERFRDGERARREAHAFAEELRYVHNSFRAGPSIYVLSDDELAERQRQDELRATLYESYVACFVDRTDGAHVIAEKLGLPFERVRQDAKIVERYLNCRRLFDTLPDARRALADFRESLTADQQKDIDVLPSLRDKHASLRADVQNAMHARRGMNDCRRERPDLFVSSNRPADDVRLFGELAHV